MAKVKYGTFLIKRMVCDKCNDGSCELLMKRKVFKGRESSKDFEAPLWIKENKCIFKSFHDAEWIEVSEAK